MNKMNYTTGEWLDQPEDNETPMGVFECDMRDDSLGWICGFVGVVEYKETRFVQGWLKTAQCPSCDNEMVAD